MDAETSFLAETSAVVEDTPTLLPDTGREGPAIGGLQSGEKVPGKQGVGKGAVLPSAILGGRRNEV